MRIWMAVVVAASLSCSATSYAQVKAETKPVSNRLVTLRVTLPDATSVQLTLPEGGLGRVTQSGGTTFGITAYIQDEAKGIVLFKVFEIKTRPSGNESIKQLEAVQHELGRAPSATSFTPAIELALLRIKPQPQASAVAPQPDWPGKCCVTCTNTGGGGSTTACGCAVVLECGDCCAGECC